MKDNRQYNLSFEETKVDTKMRNVFAQQKGEDEKLCFAQNMFGLLTSKTIPFYFYFFGLKTSTTFPYNFYF